MAADKEIIQLNGKTFIYYSNKGLVYRHSTGISWKDRNLAQNEKLINSLVKKMRDIVFNYRMDHDTNPSRDHVKALMKGESTSVNECLIDYYREFLSYKTDQVKNGNLQPNSLIDYKTLRTVLHL